MFLLLLHIALFGGSVYAYKTAKEPHKNKDSYKIREHSNKNQNKLITGAKVKNLNLNKMKKKQFL